MQYYGYIYRITYTNHNSDLYNHFYDGQRKIRNNENILDPNGKYYYHGSNVYKYTFYNGGHLLIGLKQIEFVK